MINEKNVLLYAVPTWQDCSVRAEEGIEKLVMWDAGNRTVVQEFILEGFPAVQHLGNILFLVHLLAYLASIMGNMLIITITWADHRLHTPMYFFLSTFSFVECCFITTVIPKLLAIFLSGTQVISFAACFTQAFFFLFLGSAAFFLMGVLSLDQYLAICRPLRYSSIMSPRVCSLLVTFCFTLGFLFAVAPVVHLSQLSFCGPNVIPHFFCDFGPLAKLSCSDTRSVEMLFFSVAFLAIFIPILVTVITYSHIVVTIVRLPSAKERQKAFSTCLSHLIVLSLIYGSCLFIYVKPKQTSRVDFNRQAALVNTVLSPVLNPVIYTLRNKQVHQALRGALCRGK
ncbi:olfactory receptor 2AP1-like [Lepus europaeus]|uniref:olfactory receptor 2AP1-like n=1 Tax=Lepus europaeus TaxID=9983 RepID=UPI002B47E0DF|nr:olfactory receptor 2AP1-like [Lepus europaeus]